MFERSASYLSASWWMVDSCIARIGEQGMPPGFSVHCMARIERERERGGQGTLMFERSTSDLWGMVDACMARIGEQGLSPGFSEHKLRECLLVDGGFMHGADW